MLHGVTNITGLHNVFNDDRGAGVVGIDSITDRFGKGRVPTLFAKIIELRIKDIRGKDLIDEI